MTAPGEAGPGRGRPDEDGSAAERAATYEHSRDELAEVVATLEAGGLSLDESLALWERGERLAAICTRFLDGARERVEAALAAGSAEAGSDRT